MAEEVDRRMAMELVQRAITRSLEELAKETSETTILWPSSEEFTVESGQRAIERTVQVCGFSVVRYKSMCSKRA